MFEAFTEDMSLFASFAMLMNFPRFNKMNGMGQIVSWSVRDDIREVANTMVGLEEGFVDQAFNLGSALDPKRTSAMHTVRRGPRLIRPGGLAQQTHYHMDYRQRTLLRSIACPARAPAPAPRIVPNISDPPGAMALPNRPPAMPPTISPVVPSERRQ